MGSIPRQYTIIMAVGEWVLPNEIELPPHKKIQNVFFFSSFAFIYIHVALIQEAHFPKVIIQKSFKSEMKSIFK